MKLHLGCGKRYLEGYYHVDMADYDHIDLQHDIASLPMFKDDEVGLIYCSHALEYYDRIEVVDVLKEWYRILRPNGLLRLAVPDFEQYVSLYSVNHDLNALLGPMYGRWQIGNTDKIIYHKTTYDFVALKRILEICGFSNIRRWNPMEVLPKDYDDFSYSMWPHIKDCESVKTYRNGHMMSLNVECNKH